MNVQLFSYYTDNPLLAKADTYVNMLLERLASAIALPNSGVLADSQLIIDIAEAMISLNTDLQNLKEGDLYEREAYASSECKNSESYMQTALFSGAPSLLGAATEGEQTGDYSSLALVVWAMKDSGILTGVSGFMGQLQLFLDQYPSETVIPFVNQKFDR